MDWNELSQLISDTSADCINLNMEYIQKHHQKEIDTLLAESPNPSINEVIHRYTQSYLRSAIELSTLNTLKVLEKLGVLDDLPK